MVDFGTAVTDGLAARIDLGVNKPAVVDKVLVFGVRASVDPEAASRLLASLFDAHRYTDGLELLSVGTPTNVTEHQLSGWSSERRRPRRSGPDGVSADVGRVVDGARLADALGVDRVHLAGVPGADGHCETDARAMLTTIWAGTFGYFMAQMLATSVSESERGLLRDHALAWVRGRGPVSRCAVAATRTGCYL